MAQAIFGLLGVIVGAVVTGAVEWFQTNRGLRGRLRAAARLVRDELRTAAAAMSHADTYDDEAAIASDVRDTLKRGTITRAAWLEHRGLLAEGLGDDEWETLGVAYLLIALVDQYHDADKSDLVEVVREGGAEDGPIADAISALTPHAYPTAGALAGRRRG